MPTPMIPIKIERRSTDTLVVTYQNDREYKIPAALLRANCPCAMCREQRGDGESHARPLTAKDTALKKPASLKVIEHTVDESNRLEQVWSIGNYAIGIRWGDGHDDGIFAWPYLRSLAVESFAKDSNDRTCCER